MIRLILITFGFLGFAFYEMSGGSEFEAKREAQRQEALLAAKAESDVIEVTRADTSAFDLNALTEATSPVLTPVSFETTAAQSLNEPVTPTEPAVELAVAASTEAQGDVAKPVLEIATLAQDATDEAAVVDAEPAEDIRYISGNRVNMRSGPGTKYSVLTKLKAGDAVVVLQEPGNGWIKLRTVKKRRIGWMADFLVTAQAN